jgi:hypothetical protein
MKRQLKSFLSLGAALVVGSFIQVAPVHAIVFDLNCVMSGGVCSPSGSFGTVTIVDGPGGDVTLTVNLGGATVVPNKILTVFGNYNDALFSNSTVFTTVLNPTYGVDVSENNTNTPGGGTGFDFQIPDPPPGNIGAIDTYTEQLHTTVGLTAANFNFANSSGVSFAVHIGNIACASVSCLGQSGENSVTVGSIASTVPEPASVILLGSGLAGIGLWGMKRRKNA